MDWPAFPIRSNASTSSVSGEEVADAAGMGGDVDMWTSESVLGGSSQDGCKRLNNRTIGSKSPKNRIIPLPNGLFMACKWGLTTD